MSRLDAHPNGRPIVEEMPPRRPGFLQSLFGAVLFVAIAVTAILSMGGHQ